MKNFFLLLFPILFFGQNKNLTVTINQISSKEVNSQNTIYTIDYQIENVTSNSVSFFLVPNALIANTASSMTLFPVYKIYQNGIFEDMDGPFFEYETEDELTLATIENRNSQEFKNLLNKIQEEKNILANDVYKKYQEEGGKNEDFLWVYYNHKMLSNVITLGPNEIKKLSIKTLWNKNRYVKNDHLEYYLDENNKIEMELILDLKTNQFKDNLSEDDLAKINANPNFITGIFVSNKMEINFKE
ncbi:hypothetical protein [Flavobacterium sp.]